MAEVYVSGQIESADGFGDNRLCCRWTLQTGGGWRVVEGAVEGQTQTDLPSVFDEAYFAHPIDLHLATKTIQGWPRIQLQVWHHDIYGRQELVGYGSLFLPSTPGEHEVSSLAVLEDATERMRISTVAMGQVRLRLYVITRHFEQFGILS
nr:B9 domain containing protein [Haemonchus contortus]